MHPPPTLITFRCADCGYTQQTLFITNPLCDDCQLWAYITELPRADLDEIVALFLDRRKIPAIHIIHAHLDTTLAETVKVYELIETLMQPGKMP